MKGAAVLSIALLIAGCTHPPVIPKEELAHQSDLTDGLRQIAHLIGTYDIKQPPRRNECPVHVVARIASASIDYQRAVDVTGSATGEGNIPLGPVILTPSVTGSIGRVQTVKETYKLDFKPEDAKPHTRLSEPLDAAGVDAVTLKAASTLQAEIERQIGSILAGRHSKPCIEPKSFIMTATTQLQKKVGGGFSLNIIVAKIGATGSTSTTDTQSVTLEIQLGGSAAFI